MISATIALSVLFISAPPTANQSFGALVQECRQVINLDSQPAGAATQESLADGISCLSYLRGAVDLLNVMLAVGEPGPKACIPPETTTEELARTTVKYADAHPELLDEHKALGALQAFLVTYGCDTGKPSKRESPPAPNRIG